MNKKIVKLAGIAIILTLMISFSGCLDDEQEVDPDIQAILDAGKLVIGTSAPYEPMEYFDESGNIIGFDIDIAKAIADEIGVETEIQNIDFDELLGAVEDGTVDIAIAAITITVERSEQVLFSNAYLNAGQVIIINSSTEDISNTEDLDGETIGVQSGTTSEDEAKKYTQENLTIGYKDYTDALTALINGSVDAIIIDYPAGVGLIKGHEDLEIVGDPFTDELYGIAIQKGKSGLKTLIDGIIASGTIKDLEATWF